MLELFDQIEAAKDVISQKWDKKPRAGIILGTGLGSLAEQIEQEASIEYEEIPHFPKSTAIGHRGRLICGQLSGLPIVAMEGRVHKYEGYSLKQITLPVRVMKALGAQLLIATQAVGGMNPYYRCGDILVVTHATGGMNPYFELGDVMVIEDQINLMGDNPLIGINDDRLGPRFPDMSEPYHRELISVGLEVARKENFAAHKGVMVAVTGPNLETRAEYRFLRMIGADVVGMSTVPEVIVAAHCGLKVFGISVVTDLCFPDSLEPVDVEKIIAVANAAEPKMRKLILGVLAHVAKS